MFYKLLLYTYVCVRYVTKIVLNVRFILVMVVFLTFDPVFDANILNDRYQA